MRVGIFFEVPGVSSDSNEADNFMKKLENLLDKVSEETGSIWNYDYSEDE